MRGSASKPASRMKDPGLAGSVGSERPKGDDGPGIGDPGNRLHLLSDEMTNVDVAFNVELGENVVMAGDRINLRGDLGLGQRAGDLVGAAQRAFDLDEKGLHAVIAPAWLRRAQQLPRLGPG